MSSRSSQNHYFHGLSLPRYEKEGVDELVVLDITASHEGRKNHIETIKKVADSEEDLCLVLCDRTFCALPRYRS